MHIRKFDGGDIANHIYNRGSHPAEVFEFVKFDIKPLAAVETPAYGAGVTGIQIGGVQVGDGWPVAAVRLFVDCHRRESKGGGGAWPKCFGDSWG